MSVLRAFIFQLLTKRLFQNQKMEILPGEDGGLLASSAFDDQIIRRGFVKKVYGILTAQLFATMAVMALFQVKSRF